MSRPLVKDMPERERPLSEQYRLAANQWCKADAAARILEELKTTRLEQKKQACVRASGIDMADNKAERMVKASPEWEEYIIAMVDARTVANELKIEMEAIRMQERELADRNANIRAEQRLMR